MAALFLHAKGRIMLGINILKSMRLSDSRLGAGNRVCLLVQRLVLSFLHFPLDSQCPFLQAQRGWGGGASFHYWAPGGPHSRAGCSFSPYLRKTIRKLAGIGKVFQQRFLSFLGKKRGTWVASGAKRSLQGAASPEREGSW